MPCIPGVMHTSTEVHSARATPIFMIIQGHLAHFHHGPCTGDSYGAASAQLDVTFTRTGAYKVCFKLYGGAYAMIGTELLVVNSSLPTSHSAMDPVKSAAATLFTMSGGHGLSLGPQQDSAKIINERGSCLDPPAGKMSTWHAYM